MIVAKLAKAFFSVSSRNSTKNSAIELLRSLLSLQQTLRRRWAGSIHRAARRDRPDSLDSVAADADIPVIKIDRRVAMAGHELDLVADLQPVGGARYRQPPVLVGGALVGRSRLVPYCRRPGIHT